MPLGVGPLQPCEAKDALNNWPLVILQDNSMVMLKDLNSTVAKKGVSVYWINDP